MIRITNHDAMPPPEAYIKVSGGMLLDMSIHDFDLCRYFAGSEAESVYCTGAVSYTHLDVYKRQVVTSN